MAEPGAREPRRAEFVEGEAPLWPFEGVVQLWPGWLRETADGGWARDWVVRFRASGSEEAQDRVVALPGLEIDCLGGVALVSHGDGGVEFGGAPGAVSGGFWVAWGAGAVAVRGPSEAMARELAVRPSDVAVSVRGDVVRVGEGPWEREYAMRDPARGDGERWRVQARHSGDLLLLTVHPAHLGCLSGVSWLSWADTGEVAACGANTAATVLVAPDRPEAPPVLPDPEAVGDYLSCPLRMDLWSL